jgi:hypothetical protein
MGCVAAAKAVRQSAATMATTRVMPATLRRDG